MEKLEIYALKLPLIEKKADLPKLIVDEALRSGVGIQEGDVLVLTSKIVLKSLGLLVDLSSVRPGVRARLIHRITGKDPVETEIVLRNSRRVLGIVPVGFLKAYSEYVGRDRRAAESVVEKVPALMIVEMHNGLITSDAGVDYSNVPAGYAITSNHDFDRLARYLRGEIRERTGKDVSVVIADTEVFYSNGKFGSIDLAVGSSGIEPLSRKFGEKDLYGRPKFGGVDIIVDELCAAAALLMGQTSEGVPVVLVRGLRYERSDRGVSDVLVTRHRGRGMLVVARVALLNLLLKLLGAI